MTQVAIVIPTYNNLPELRACLAALAQQTFKDFTAYVCVDGSTDGTWEYLTTYKPPFVVPLRHTDGRNHGRNATRNLVLPYLANHEWLAFLDSDSLPLPEWLECLIAAQPTPQEALLGRILYFSEEEPNPWAAYLRWREEKRWQTPLSPPHFITINALIAASVFSEMGGMDAQMRRYGLGDVELGYRLRARGIRFRYVESARVWSLVQQRPIQALHRLYDMAQHNLLHVHEKHPQSRQELFGGKWLFQPIRRFVLKLILQPFVARWLLRRLERLPSFIQRWGMRYLVLYAIGRGLWRKRLGLLVTKAFSPVP